jgi:hypothetical protein
MEALLKSSFIGDRNQGLCIGPRPDRVPGFWRGLTSLTRALGLLITLVRATLDCT